MQYLGPHPPQTCPIGTALNTLLRRPVGTAEFADLRAAGQSRCSLARPQEVGVAAEAGGYRALQTTAAPGVVPRAVSTCKRPQ